MEWRLLPSLDDLFIRRGTSKYFHKGVGTLILSGTAPRADEAPITGSGTLTFSGTAPYEGYYQGQGTITLSGTAPRAGEAPITGVGILTLSGIAPRAGEIAVTGSGTITLSGSVQVEYPFHYGWWPTYGWWPAPIGWWWDADYSYEQYWE